jgi:hypothetical protein
MIAQPVPNLFWRTFVLLILLIILSVMGCCRASAS